VYAEASRLGYWRDDETARTQIVTLSAKAPTAHVALKIGPRPGELIVSVTDKTTGEAVDSFFETLIADTTGHCSGVGNFARDTGSSSARVPVGAATETVVEVSAKGYKNWFYSDPSSPPRCYAWSPAKNDPHTGQRCSMSHAILDPLSGRDEHSISSSASQTLS